MLQFIKNILLRLVAGANAVTILFLLLCGLSTYFSPASYPRLSVVGLAFPAFLVVNLLFIPFWLIFHIRYVWIPFAGLLICFPFVRDYCPLNWPEEPPADAIKVISYNAHGFSGSTKDEAGHYAAADYLANSGADIICLQEAYKAATIKREYLDSVMKANGYHAAAITDVPDKGVICYSKFPVLSVASITYESQSNGSVLCQLKDGNDTLCLINNHFESNKLTPDDKTHYKEMIKDPELQKVENGTRRLVSKMAKAAALRAVQVDTVAARVRALKGTPVIVCGDFNDSPISYSYRVLTEVLSSAFEQSGNGLGVSYNQKGFYVRIDHILFSDEWESWHTYVDKSIPFSDHYPLVSYLKRAKK